MASLMENIKTIETAVYGKEMRPAIVEALMATKDRIFDLVTQGEELQQRVDALEKGGGDKPDPGQTGGSAIFMVDMVVNVVVSRTAAIGAATLI